MREQYQRDGSRTSSSRNGVRTSKQAQSCALAEAWFAGAQALGAPSSADAIGIAVTAANAACAVQAPHSTSSCAKGSVLVVAAEPELTRGLICRASLDARIELGRAPAAFLHPFSADEISAAADTQPRLMLFDVGLVAMLGIAQVLELRRRHPALEWMLGWQVPDPAVARLILLTRAVGGMAWGLQPAEIWHAIDSVLAGELWFSRSLLRSLYLALLAGVEEPPAAESESAAKAASPRSLQAPLSARESKVTALLHDGWTNKQIARRLGISPNTVKKHVAHAFHKLGIHTRRQCLG